MNRRAKLGLSAIGFFALAAGALALRGCERDQATELLWSRPLPELPELSGIVYDEEQQCLFAVSDQGWVGELDLEGRLLRRRHLKRGWDLEDLCLSPDGSRLLIVEERKRQLIEVDRDSFEVLRRRKLPQPWKSAINLGYEGIDLLDDKTLVLAHQDDPAALVFVDVESLELKGQLELPVENLAALRCRDEGALFLLLVEDEALVAVDRLGQLQGPRLALPSPNPEGLAIVGTRIYIAQDDDPSRIQLLDFGGSPEAWRRPGQDR